MATDCTIEPPAQERDRDNPQRRAYAQRIAAVVRYIENNLDEDLCVDALAELIGFSRFHFHRQFTSFSGIGIARLVRLLRLRRAANQLALQPERPITDIAFDAGFSSGEAFARAFRDCFNASPSEFRKRPRWHADEVTPVLRRLQETPMNTHVELVEFPETRVAAVEYRGLPENEYLAIARLVAWRRENGVPPSRGMTIGVHYSDPAQTRPEDYRIDICVSFEGEITDNAHGVVERVIPGGRCARIRHVGARNYMPEAEFIYREWLPDSGETLRDFPPFFHYVNVGPDVREAEMITDIYLPLV